MGARAVGSCVYMRCCQAHDAIRLDALCCQPAILSVMSSFKLCLQCTQVLERIPEHACPVSARLLAVDHCTVHSSCPRTTTQRVSTARRVVDLLCHNISALLSCLRLSPPNNMMTLTSQPATPLHCPGRSYHLSMFYVLLSILPTLF